MKRILCLVLGIGLLGAMTLTSGCFGDDGIGSIFAAAILITIVVSTAGTGGAGAAAFAASTRERAGIVAPATRSLGVTANGLRLRVTPYSNGASVGDPVLSANITTNNTIQATGSISISAGTTDYLVELLASNTSVMQSRIYTSTDVTVTVNPDTTAKSLIYTEWLKRNPADKSVENFEKNFAFVPTADDALATTLYNLINDDTVVASLSNINLASTTLISAATTAASGISTESRVIPSGTANYGGTWHVTSSTSPSSFMPVFVSQTGSSLSGSVNGITHFTGSVTGQQAVLTMTTSSGSTETWNLTMASGGTEFSGSWSSIPSGGGSTTTGTLTGVKQ